MRDALNLVIVQFAIVIAVAALAGGVLGWAIGRGRRKRALTRNEAEQSQAVAPMAGPPPQAEEADDDPRVRMVAPAQPLTAPPSGHGSGQLPEHGIAPLASPESGQGVAEATVAVIPEMPRESVDPAVSGTPVLPQEIGEPMAAPTPEPTQESVESASMGIPVGADTPESPRELLESADIGTAPVVSDSDDHLGSRSDTDPEPGVDDLWPSLPAEANAPVAYGIDEPVAAALHVEADEDRLSDPLAGHDLGTEYRNEFDTALDPYSTSVEIDEPSEMIPVVGTDLDALGPDVADANSDFDGATHLDPDTLAPYTGGKVAPATGSAPLDLAADVQSEAYPATNAEHMTNTDAQVDPATWPSPLDTGSMQPVVLFPTANAVSEPEEVRSQDLFPTLAPNQERDDQSSGRLSEADLPEPAQDLGSFSPSTGSETVAASAESLGTPPLAAGPSLEAPEPDLDPFTFTADSDTFTAPASAENPKTMPLVSEDSAGVTAPGVSVDPSPAKEGFILADVPTAEAWATGSQPAVLDPWNEVHAPEVLADAVVRGPLAEAQGENREPETSPLVETGTVDIESWNEVHAPGAAVVAEPEVHEVGSPAASGSGDEPGGPGVGLPGIDVPAGPTGAAPVLGVSAPVVAAGAGLAAMAAADRLADVETPSAETPHSEVEDTEASIGRMMDIAEVEAENSEIIPAVMDEAEAIDDRAVETEAEIAEISEERTLDEPVEAAGPEQDDAEGTEVDEPGAGTALADTDAALDDATPEAEPVAANSTEATVARLVTYEQLYDEWGTETIAAVRDPEQSADSDIEHLRAQVAALKEQIVQKDVEMMRLETGATAAWDTTVPSLQQTITELREDNGRLASALREARSNLESMALELDRMQKPRGPLLPPEQSH